MPALLYRQNSDNPFGSPGQNGGGTITTNPVSLTSTQSKAETQTQSSKEPDSSTTLSPPEPTESAQTSSTSSDHSQTSQSLSTNSISLSSATAVSAQSSTIPGTETVTTSELGPSSSSTTANPVVTNLVEPRTHRAAVAGGVVGGLIAFAFLLVAGYMLIRRKRKLRKAAISESGAANEKPKTYYNLDMQEGPLSPPGFFPREYRGSWSDADVRFKSTPHMI